MPYVPGFSYDIFISYAHDDNITMYNIGMPPRGWMVYFHNIFKQYMKHKLGESDGLNIFFDESNDTGLKPNEQLQKLETAATSSAVFLVMGSRAYLRRPWTKRELTAFQLSQEVPGHVLQSRIFLTECVPLVPGDKYPYPIEDHRKLNLWVEVPGTTDVMEPWSSDFRQNVGRLADDVADKLRHLREASMISASEDTPITEVAPAVMPPAEPPLALTIEAPASSRTRGDSEAFVAILREEQERLRAKGIEAEGERITDLPVRVPNFLLFKRPDGKIVMGICGESVRVNPRRLQKTSEPQVEARFLPESDLAALGFAPEKVHPLFIDAENKIHRIFLDSTIYFQAVYFPNSVIRLPIYSNDGRFNLDVEIGAFVNALKRIHGDKYVPATIAAGKWNDETLIAGLERLGIETRFAPTPDGSLHVGNVRAVLIPYIMYMAKPKKNNFVLRIDDTDLNTGNDITINLIKGQLKWLGINVGPDRTFQESSLPHQAIYRDIYNLLHVCGMIVSKDHDYWLNWENPAAHFGAWFDISNGPRIIHYPPAAKENIHELATLSLRSRRGNAADRRFDYKFCGTIDDLLWSSFISRDVEQGRTLTQRQALIRNAIEVAWHRASDSESQEVRERVLAMRATLRGREEPPFPLFAPPIYYHAPLVVEPNPHAGNLRRDGKVEGRTRKISKRNRDVADQGDKTQFFFLDHMMSQFRLPETVVSYMLATIVPPAEHVANSVHRKQMAQICAEFGAEQAIDIIASQSSMRWLRGARSDILANANDIGVQERYVLQKISYFTYYRRMMEVKKRWQLNRKTEEVLDLILEKLFPYLRYMASWGEAVQIVRRWRSDVVYDPRVEILFDVAKRLAQPGRADRSNFQESFRQALPKTDAVDFEETCAEVRHLLTGLPYSQRAGSVRCPGPPLRVLADVLSPEYENYRGAK